MTSRVLIQLLCPHKKLQVTLDESYTTSWFVLTVANPLRPARWNSYSFCCLQWPWIYLATKQRCHAQEAPPLSPPLCSARALKSQLVELSLESHRVNNNRPAVSPPALWSVCLLSDSPKTSKGPYVVWMNCDLWLSHYKSGIIWRGSSESGGRASCIHCNAVTHQHQLRLRLTHILHLFHLHLLHQFPFFCGVK